MLLEGEVCPTLCEISVGGEWWERTLRIDRDISMFVEDIAAKVDNAFRNFCLPHHGASSSSFSIAGLLATANAPPVATIGSRTCIQQARPICHTVKLLNLGVCTLFMIWYGWCVPIHVHVAVDVI